MAKAVIEDLPTLTISPEKVCFVVVKAREFDVKDVVTDPDDASNATDDGMLAVELLRCRAVLIAERKFFRRTKLNRAAIGQPAGKFQRTFETFLVEPQRGVGDIGLRRDAAHHVLGVRHARHRLRIDERDDLNAFKPGPRQGVDQRDLARGGDGAFFDLKAFARAFLGDTNGAG